jgi:hypothetical protein
MLRLVKTTRVVGALRVQSTRGFAGSANSRVKIIGSHDAYKTITAVRYGVVSSAIFEPSSLICAVIAGGLGQEGHRVLHGKVVPSVQDDLANLRRAQVC